MRILPRVLVVMIMFFVTFLLIRHVKIVSEAEDFDKSLLIKYYFWILSFAITTALVTCIALLPLFGEFTGNVFFNPNEKIERNPHADAMARLAAGDVEGAIEEYRAVFEDDPQDLHAASEVIRLFCEKLHQPEPAADFLVEALSYEDRTQEEIAFLSQRLVDVCRHYLHDGIRARAILIRIAEDMPESREAANAIHRLQEIDRIMNQDIYYSQALRAEKSANPEGTGLEQKPGA